MTAGLSKGGPPWATPEKIANGIIRALDRRRAIPEPVFKRMQLWFQS